MTTETENNEELIAWGWHKKIYTKDEAMLTADQQSLNFLNIIEQFKRIEHETEVEINGN